MTHFPMTVRYIDKNEILVVNKPDDIQKGRPFVVESTSYQWGRKASTNQPSNEEADYE